MSAQFQAVQLRPVQASSRALQRVTFLQTAVTAYESFRASDGAGGFEQYQVSDGEGGYENFEVAE